MNKSAKGNEPQFLEDLLTPLVKRWGHAEVRRHLDMLEGKYINRAKSRQIDETSKRSRRLTAHEYVEKRVQAPPERRDALLELASRFDEKRFLPSIGDVRRFLGIRDPKIEIIERREAAIPKLIQVLQGLSGEQLQGILRDENYAGPARLGPLSKAIRESSAMRIAKG